MSAETQVVKDLFGTKMWGDGTEQALLSPARIEGEDVARAWSPEESAKHPREKAGTSKGGKFAHKGTGEVAEGMAVFETEHRYAENETLLLMDGSGFVFRKSGNEGSIQMTPEEMARVPAGSVGSHNHPTPTNFSPDDMRFATDLNLSETRMVCADGLFTLRPGSGGWLPADWKDRVPQEFFPAAGETEGAPDGVLVWVLCAWQSQQARNELLPLVQSGAMTPAEATRAHRSRSIPVIAGFLGWQYEEHQL